MPFSQRIQKSQYILSTYKQRCERYKLMSRDTPSFINNNMKLTLTVLKLVLRNLRQHLDLGSVFLQLLRVFTLNKKDTHLYCIVVNRNIYSYHLNKDSTVKFYPLRKILTFSLPSVCLFVYRNCLRKKIRV